MLFPSLSISGRCQFMCPELYIASIPAVPSINRTIALGSETSGYNDNKTVVIGFTDNPPFAFEEEGRPKGIRLEIAGEVIKRADTQHLT
jgi:hypothetical protein